MKTALLMIVFTTLNLASARAEESSDLVFSTPDEVKAFGAANNCGEGSKDPNCKVAQFASEQMTKLLAECTSLRSDGSCTAEGGSDGATYRRAVLCSSARQYCCDVEIAGVIVTRVYGCRAVYDEGCPKLGCSSNGTRLTGTTGRDEVRVIRSATPKRSALPPRK